MSSLELSQPFDSTTASPLPLQFRIKRIDRSEDKGQGSKSLEKAVSRDRKLEQLFSKDRFLKRDFEMKEELSANNSFGLSPTTPDSPIKSHPSASKGFFLKRQTRLESSSNSTHSKQPTASFSRNSAADTSLPLHQKLRLDTEPKLSSTAAKSKFIIKHEDSKQKSSPVSTKKSCWSPYRPSKLSENSLPELRAFHSEFDAVIQTPFVEKKFAVGGSENDSNMKLNDLLMSPDMQNKVLSLDMLRQLTKPSKGCSDKIIPCLKATPKTLPAPCASICAFAVGRPRLGLRRKCVSVDKKVVSFSQNVLVYAY